MAKNQYLSGTQRSIVNRYYSNQDVRVVQKLQELVSDLYITTDEKAKQKKWAIVHREMSKSNAEQAKVKKIVEGRDIKALAELINAPGFSAEGKKPEKPSPAVDDV